MLFLRQFLWSPLFFFLSVLEMQKSSAQKTRLYFFTGLYLLGAVASDTGHLFHSTSLLFCGSQKWKLSKFWIYEIYGNKMNPPKEKLEKKNVMRQNSLHLASNSLFYTLFLTLIKREVQAIRTCTVISRKQFYPQIVPAVIYNWTTITLYKPVSLTSYPAENNSLSQLERNLLVKVCKDPV